MTILPKKKPSKDKSEAENVERPLSPGGPAEGRGGARRPSSPGGPPRWSSPPPVDHDRGPAGHEPPGRYEETASGSGNKRRLRHRSPPHGVARKQRHESARTGALCAGATAGIAHARLSGIRQATTSAAPPDQRTNATSHVAVVGQALAPEEERACSGYNSEDECTPRPCDQNVEEVV